MPKTAEQINKKDFKQAAREIKAWRNQKASSELELSKLQEKMLNLQEEYRINASNLQSEIVGKNNEILNAIEQVEQIATKVISEYDDTAEKL